VWWEDLEFEVVRVFAAESVVIRGFPGLRFGFCGWGFDS